MRHTLPAHPRTLPRPAWYMCSHAAILVPALPEHPRGHPLLSTLARCPLGAPSRPQLVGLVCGPGGGPNLAAGLAQGWHAEHMRDRACLGVWACLCWPGL